MKKRVVGVLIALIFVGILCFILFPKTGFVTQALNSNYLQELSSKAEVECLQNSQCSNDSECVGNVCIDKKEINLCQSVSLSTPARKIKIGDSVNSIKGILTKADLPYLLSDGELVEVINGKPMEYFYISYITIGDNKLNQEEENYAIENNKPLYTYKIIFSNPVDFSNKNIQGQALRIFGQEYVIDSNSDNSNIYLISDRKDIKLENKDNIKIVKDEHGNILSIEIAFLPEVKLKNNENFTEPIFGAVKFSFDSTDGNSADIKIGGNC